MQNNQAPPQQRQYEYERKLATVQDEARHKLDIVEVGILENGVEVPQLIKFRQWYYNGARRGSKVQNLSLPPEALIATIQALTEASNQFSNLQQPQRTTRATAMTTGQATRRQVA